MHSRSTTICGVDIRNWVLQEAETGIPNAHRDGGQCHGDACIAELMHVTSPDVVVPSKHVQHGSGAAYVR